MSPAALAPQGYPKGPRYVLLWGILPQIRMVIPNMETLHSTVLGTLWVDRYLYAHTSQHLLFDQVALLGLVQLLRMGCAQAAPTDLVFRVWGLLSTIIVSTWYPVVYTIR